MTRAPNDKSDEPRTPVAGFALAGPEELGPIAANPLSLDDSAKQDSAGEPPPVGGVPPAAPSAGVPFEDIYERYFEFVWRSLRLLGVPQASLDDAMQDVFNTVARQLSRFEGRSSLRTWIFGITQFTAANHRRAERRKSAPLQPLDNRLVSSDAGPHDHAEARQLAELVTHFCAELDEGHRAVFALSLLEGVPAAEIAELLAIPVNTVYSRARALKHALRRRLEQREMEQ